MKIPLMELESHVLDCPACSLPIVAKVSVKVALTAGERVGNTVPCEAKTTMERFNVTHHCGGLAECTDEDGAR